MKRKLLLFLSKLNCSANIPIAATLAWLSKSKNCLFDNYYDSYHEGVHFPGGDSRNLEPGQLTGGTVSGDRHFEELYFILLNFDVSVISFGETIFLSCLRNLHVPIVALSDDIGFIYKEVFRYLNLPMPPNIVMTGSNFRGALAGLEAYFYPEIFHRQAIGVPDSISQEQLAGLYQKGGKIFSLYADEMLIGRLVNSGYDIEVVDLLKENDDYFGVTKRIAMRWKQSTKGWILGDPTLVAYWLPRACEENLVAIYSVPQQRIVTQLGDLISSKGKVIYGRQYSDKDFFELSKLDQCLQVIDPGRPPFQSVKHVDYAWYRNQNEEGFYDSEYSDEELRQFAHEGRILVSLMFWSGMIREVENFYNLMDLFAITRLKCGLVVTSHTYEYMMHSPFELIMTPIEQGGVYPLVEPVLGSCGIGVGIESCIRNERLQETLRDGLSRIFEKVRTQSYVPRGWWATMDTDLEKLRWSERPKPIRILSHSPYFQIRFHRNEKTFSETPNSSNGGASVSIKQRSIERIKRLLEEAGLQKYFSAYRPYEFFGAGPIRKDIINSAKSVGLKYMFTKAGFNSSPKVQYLDGDFVALNYTAGQWDGWTPFETINNISDLRKCERLLLKRNRPGWIVSTIDSCLWTFTGEFWKRGNKLYEIAQFCARGGDSGRLINVKPFTISRYARIIAEKDR